MELLRMYLESLKLSVGDTVQVLFALPTGVHGYEGHFASNMNRMIGREYAVKEIDEAAGLIKLNSYWFPSISLGVKVLEPFILMGNDDKVVQITYSDGILVVKTEDTTHPVNVTGGRIERTIANLEHLTSESGFEAQLVMGCVTWTSQTLKDLDEYLSSNELY